MLVFLSPERAFAKSIGDEPLGSVPEFLPEFRGDVLAVGPPPAGAAGAAPPTGGDPAGAGAGAAAGEPGPPARWRARGGTSPRGEWRGGQGRLGWAEGLRGSVPAAIAGLGVVQVVDLASGNSSFPLTHPSFHHVDVSGSFGRNDQPVVGPLGHGRKSFRRGVIGRRRRELGVVGICESRHRRRFDRERIEPPARVAALLEDGLGSVLVGPITVKFAGATRLRSHRQESKDRSPPESSVESVRAFSSDPAHGFPSTRHHETARTLCRHKNSRPRPSTNGAGGRGRPTSRPRPRSSRGSITGCIGCAGCPS